MKAYDPDIQDRDLDQHIVYSVVKEDQKKLLQIDQSGCLSLIKPLDRDPPNGYAAWQVIIQASDESGGPKSLAKTTEVIITLRDINDNAPYLDMVSYMTAMIGFSLIFFEWVLSFFFSTYKLSFMDLIKFLKSVDSSSVFTL